MSKLTAKNRSTGEIREFEKYEEVYFVYDCLRYSDYDFNSEWEVIEKPCKECINILNTGYGECLEHNPTEEPTQTIEDKIQQDLDNGKFTSICSNETTFKEYVFDLLSLHREQVLKSLRIGMLRQWLNEDRIDDPHKMVDNEEIKYWLGIKNNE